MTSAILRTSLLALCVFFTGALRIDDSLDDAAKVEGELQPKKPPLLNVRPSLLNIDASRTAAPHALEEAAASQHKLFLGHPRSGSPATDILVPEVKAIVEEISAVESFATRLVLDPKSFITVFVIASGMLSVIFVAYGTNIAICALRDSMRLSRAPCSHDEERIPEAQAAEGTGLTQGAQELPPQEWAESSETMSFGARMSLLLDLQNEQATLQQSLREANPEKKPALDEHALEIKAKMLENMRLEQEVLKNMLDSAAQEPEMASDATVNVECAQAKKADADPKSEPDIPEEILQQSPLVDGALEPDSEPLVEPSSPDKAPSARPLHSPDINVQVDEFLQEAFEFEPDSEPMSDDEFSATTSEGEASESFKTESTTATTTPPDPSEEIIFVSTSGVPVLDLSLLDSVEAATSVYVDKEVGVSSSPRAPDPYALSAICDSDEARNPARSRMA